MINPDVEEVLQRNRETRPVEHDFEERVGDHMRCRRCDVVFDVSVMSADDINSNAHVPDMHTNWGVLRNYYRCGWAK